MSDRLEAGSKIFRIPINMSHWFHALLSPEARKLCRTVDRIMIEGVKTPLTVYTFDVADLGQNKYRGFGEPRFDERGYQLPVSFADPQYTALQAGIPQQFFSTYEFGVKAYLAGDWTAARVQLSRALELYPKDGPTEGLLATLKEHNWEAPAGWPGYRVQDKY